jgi:hypothetical protein
MWRSPNPNGEPSRHPEPADKQRIAEEGNSALKKAVEAQGLTIQLLPY